MIVPSNSRSRGFNTWRLGIGIAARMTRSSRLKLASNRTITTAPITTSARSVETISMIIGPCRGRTTTTARRATSYADLEKHNENLHHIVRIVAAIAVGYPL